MFEQPSSLSGTSPEASRYYNSPAYNDAVNASRFVKGFGITALVYAALSVFGIAFLNGGVGVGIGLFVFRYDEQRFYRVLGVALMALAIVSWILPVSQVVLAGAVLGKGIQSLMVFSREGQNDEDWASSRQRALIGTIASSIALLLSTLILLLTFIGVIYLWMKGELFQ